MASGQKETIYIDIEDEITGIIDKVRGSNYKIVALVLPKRASMLQSIVNMRLLKRTADDAKKHIVLITSEASLLPLAGTVGLHVARTLQSKPSVPSAPALQSDEPVDVAEDEVGDDPEPEIDTAKSVGSLAAAAEDETIEVDEPEPTDPKGKKDKKKDKFGKKLGGKIRIPNFERFRVLLFLGGFLLILLVVGWYFAFFVMPKAKITIKTDTTTVDSDLKLTASTAAKTLDAEKLIVPALNKDFKKTDREKITATGQRDEGERAKGTVTLKNCSKGNADAVTIPAGTAVSSGNFSFITQAAVSLPPSSFNGLSVCITPAEDVDVVAQNPGSQYNINANDANGNPRTFTVAGFSQVTGTGTDMGGGSTKNVQIVSQQDVDAAKQKIMDRIGASAPDALKAEFQGDGYVALADTQTAGTPNVVSAPAVNQPATEATVDVTITYSMLGLKGDDLKQLVEKDVTRRIDTKKQVILDNGLSKATFRLSEKKGAELPVQLIATATAGPQLDADAIKKEVAGKKKGEAKSLVQARPGVKDVTVEYSPFWVLSTPKKQSKITVVFEKNADGK